MARKRLILVTGNGRSGTKTVSWLLRNVAKLDTPHEYCGDDGTVSCFFHSDHKWYPRHEFAGPRVAHVRERLREFEFTHKIHLVRHPLKSISGIKAGCGKKHQDWLMELGLLPEGVKSKLERSMYIWLNVCRRADELCDYAVRIEEIETWWPELMRDLFGDVAYLPQLPDEVPVMNKGHGRTKGPELTWEDLEEVNEELAEEIRRYAMEEHGYE